VPGRDTKPGKGWRPMTETRRSTVDAGAHDLWSAGKANEGHEGREEWVMGMDE
jgi:hypothetical protein